MELDNIHNVLNQVQIITQKNTELLDAIGGRFNIFKIVGVNHYENTHSGILAEFLNPKGTHGLKHAFLEAFIAELQEIPKYKQIADFDVRNATIQTEVQTGDGRIDILITDNKKNAIVIENKIYAIDQPEQLKRYKEYAEDKYNKNYRILFLTLYGSDASEDSSEGVEYTRVSYEKHIIDWLEKCVLLSARFPLVRETIYQYINHLKTLTHQDMDTKNSKEVIAVLAKPENIDAAFTIYDNHAAMCKLIIEESLFPQLRAIAEKLKMKFEVSSKFSDGNAEDFLLFYEADWKYLGICFYFEGNGYNNLRWGLSTRSDEFLPKYENNQFLLKPIFNEKPETGWPYGYSFFKYQNWDSNTFKAIVNESFSEQIEENITELLKVIKQNKEKILL